MKWLNYIAIFCAFNAFSQGEVDYLFEEMPSDSVAKLSISTHTSVKPAIRQYTKNPEKKSYFQVAGLGDLNFFQQVQSGYKTGLGLELKANIKDKLYFRLAGIEGIHQNSHGFQPKSYIDDSIGKVSLYSDLRGRISYTPNHIFNFQIGLDHNFIGEGARSMLLSDYGTPYPFGQIGMRFWRLEYVIMYQFLRERDNNRWEGKFASSHHISFNATKWLNIGIFETVLFQPKDTLVNRGFEAEYLNPFVFYRPQEYSVGSSDNVLIGFDLSAKYKKHTLYAQFILDEFSWPDIKARNGWWASKYGGQLGVKGRFNKIGHDLFYRVEYNFARPYTYAHLSEEVNYGNQGRALAHPYGSNFHELLVELKWEHGKWFGKIFANYFLRGKDKDGFNYGNDVYTPYINRPYEYGHTIGQGQGLNGTKVVLTSGYKLLKHGKLNAFLEHHLGYTTLDNKLNYSLVVGVRSMLWNDYRNY
jgi:hypothetical protein